jgi:hypothetical protein
MSDIPSLRAIDTATETDLVEVVRTTDGRVFRLKAALSDLKGGLDGNMVTTDTAQAVSGAKTFSGTNIFSTMFRIPTATVAATGNSQGTAAGITTGFTLVTGADDTKGVILPVAAAGLVCIIKVGDGADLKVYPNSDDAINGLAANAAMTVVDDVCFALIALDATTWYTLPLLPS